MTQAYDVIPDIHADIGRLTRTFLSLGYMPGHGSWSHPEGRITAFLGDFIDMGRSNRSVLTLVRAMRDPNHSKPYLCRVKPV
ncbi:MAG: hypothetical protein ACK4L4_18945 [Gemmobacter sp.]